MVTHHLEKVKEHFNRNDLNINLIVGMTPLSGISEPHHKNFVKLARDRASFNCSYIKPLSTPIHTKIYIWLSGGKPQTAFLTSANYTINAFRRRQDEAATECDAVEAYAYYQAKIPDSFYCTCDEATGLIRKENDGRFSAVAERSDDRQQQVTAANNIKSVELPLFSVKNGKMHIRSGLNWGQRDGREPNQAYIPVPSDIAQSGFFPPRGDHFSVLTDDGCPFVCVVAQDKNKAIETPNNNSEMGEYFRRKLGVPLGNPVALADLDRYGNRYVKFTKIDDEEYYMEYNPSLPRHSLDDR
ncbi:NgoFVII family restriction endonuclease [Planctomycetales bacterium]|nr:NgoFVII family restriction endonuclease [Planctomycetales bacterium]GHT06773.1 NgoFVII family restriction endonuclease [Planctomycetales bacterium]